jgi:hypothetical protein
VVAFLAAGYPVLFGIADAPSLGQLLAADSGRFGRLLGLVYFVSLAVPLLPLRLWPALILPVQGICAAALLFVWMNAAVGNANYPLWPGAGPAALIAAVSAAAFWLAAVADAWLAVLSEDAPVPGTLLREGILLLTQVPAILIYTLALGAQWPT